MRRLMTLAVWLFVAAMGGMTALGVLHAIAGGCTADLPRMAAGAQLLVPPALFAIALVLYERCQCEDGGDDGDEDELEPEPHDDEAVTVPRRPQRQDETRVN